MTCFTPTSRSLSRCVLILACALMASCATKKKTYKELTRLPARLKRMANVPTTSLKSHYNLHLSAPVITDVSFSERSTLHKTKGYTLPLLLYYAWKKKFEYTIGKNGIETDISNFVYEGWMSHSVKGGMYQTNPNAPADFILEIEIDSLSAKGPYSKRGSRIVLLDDQHIREAIAGPAVAFSRITYRLKKDDKVLWKKATEHQQNVDIAAVYEDKHTRILSDSKSSNADILRGSRRGHHFASPVVTSPYYPSTLLLPEQKEHFRQSTSGDSFSQLAPSYTFRLVDALSATLDYNLHQVIQDVNFYIKENYPEDLTPYSYKKTRKPPM